MNHSGYYCFGVSKSFSEFSFKRINKLSKTGIILGDNSHSTDKLIKFSIENNRRYILFREEPLNHWCPGAGIGVSYPEKT